MLSNKNIIVTGSSSGIGLSITKALLKNKANVLGVSRRNPNFSNKNYHHIQFDLSNIETEYEKLSSVIKEKPIDGLISNAGSGKFDSSFQLLETGYFEKMTIGIAGHPEGSPDISDSDLEKAMKDKKPYADYIVTQWLLDPQPIIDFISKQSVPVHVGITGPLKISSLIKFANIVGAKNSLNFLKSNFSKALDLLKPKDPNDLIGKVKSHTDFFHIYTFGGLKETNKWLKENSYV